MIANTRGRGRGGNVEPEKRKNNKKNDGVKKLDQKQSILHILSFNMAIS